MTTDFGSKGSGKGQPGCGLTWDGEGPQLSHPLAGRLSQAHRELQSCCWGPRVHMPPSLPPPATCCPMQGTHFSLLSESKVQ